ncbi:MAG: 1-(5-phosphoribosyl)-5-[(5-phosphoribosylamino)methylideneamino]imidazole-4-carboxamide isomerase [Dysgonamonadaceae bacterium]|jgi:phosphoribosylformimino-5-aminoimidazole carboxamide ribotide isomerase|nr:1-(5-phosphoribosyl)-5-[(5-phosphoribosylamino)methylideneamino]imidazole-4-carboxamide isomerase [Dysgonamonadaceae bacterium]
MIEIIPAMDILDGQCVRLSQGDYERKTVYNENPLEVAKILEAHGIRRLHVVDLDGAKAHRIINYRVLEQIASHTSLIIDFGGGLKTDADLQIAFDCGARMVTGGSIAVKNPEAFQGWIDRFGAQSIILGADCRNRKIAVSGWLETTDEEVIPFIEKWRKQGIARVICTDISKDGMLDGVNTDLYRELLENDPELYLIASGGVGDIHDVEQLEEAHIPGVIIGKALYEGRITLQQITGFLC